MITGLKKINAVITYNVHDSMLFSQASRLLSRRQILERLWFTYAGKRLS